MQNKKEKDLERLLMMSLYSVVLRWRHLLTSCVNPPSRPAASRSPLKKKAETMLNSVSLQQCEGGRRRGVGGHSPSVLFLLLSCCLFDCDFFFCTIFFFSLFLPTNHRLWASSCFLVCVKGRQTRAWLRV